MPAPFVTLITDFGGHDPYVGIMKSRLQARLADVPIVDLTHAITPFRPEEAGFWLWRSAPQFPPGTVHVAVVDPGVGTARSLVAVRAARQLFVAPDNGLLGLVWQGSAPAEAVRVTSEALARLGLSATSATFHGRDLIAPLGAELAAGRCRFEELGPAVTPEPGRLKPAAERERVIDGVIAAIDRYGNLLSTVEASTLKTLRAPQITYKGRRFPMVNTYGEARNGTCVALVNSFGVLEIACSCGNAAETLEAEWGTPLQAVEGSMELNAGANQL
jgi:S-adenosylmethionine hydrolase